jgi:antitoxin component of MazEF toxin-antitoxin module
MDNYYWRRQQKAIIINISQKNTDRSFMLMLKQTITVNDSVSVCIPQEIVEALGFTPGSQINLEVVGNTLIIRSATEAQRAEEFVQTFQSILERRKSAYEELATGES